jgi:hypothetical protein
LKCESPALVVGLLALGGGIARRRVLIKIFRAGSFGRVFAARRRDQKKIFMHW